LRFGVIEMFFKTARGGVKFSNWSLWGAAICSGSALGYRESVDMSCEIGEFFEGLVGEEFVFDRRNIEKSSLVFNVSKWVDSQATHLEFSYSQSAFIPKRHTSNKLSQRLTSLRSVSKDFVLSLLCIR
jgi:hypothetical protein